MAKKRPTDETQLNREITIEQRETEGLSLGTIVRRRFFRHKAAVISLIVLGAVTVLAFTSALKKIKNPETLQVMTWLRDLFGFTLLEENLAWYLMNGRLNSQRAEAITDYIDGRLLGRLKPHALDLVDAFGLSEGLIRSDLAFGAEAQRRETLKKAKA